MSYGVMPMSEIARLPWNGYNVVSTFSGGGGSCTGYRMAGYRVAWANEFIPAAQETYRANHPDTFLNTSDIRTVSPEQVVEESGLGVGEIDLFDGSPPCAAFSTAGARDRLWGKEKKYSDTYARVDDLFFEYTRLVGALQPKTFVAENVSGLVKGKAKGYFKLILSEMKSCGYTVSARLLNAAYLGVPQRRERLIFVGVRNDLVERYGVAPAHPKPERDTVTLREALEGVVIPDDDREWSYKYSDKARRKVVSQIPKNPSRCLKGSDIFGDSWYNTYRMSYEQTAPTILQARNTFAMPDEDRFMSVAECKRVMSVPDDYVLTGSYPKQFERLGRMVPPVMMSRIAKTVQTEILDRIGE